MEQVVQQLRRREPLWSELRERRILEQVMAGRAAPSIRRLGWRIGVAAAVAACMVAGLIIGRSMIPANEHSTPSLSPTTSVLALPDAGQAILHAGAKVAIVERSEVELELAQSRGRVRYELKRSLDRRVTVRAAGIAVHVVGTVFSVAIGRVDVQVAVERGTVQVEDSHQMIELSAGESIAVVRTDLDVNRESGEEVSELPVDSRERDTPGEKEAVSTRPRGGKTDAPRRRRRVPVVRPVEQMPLAEAAPHGNAVSPGTEEAGGRVSVVEQGLLQVDALRSEGRFKEAAEVIRQLIEAHPDDPRGAAVLFTLGQVERAQGRHAAAARVYRRCWTRAPNGLLAEDARAQEAASLHAARRYEAAREAARQYLELYPGGIHRRQMADITR